MSILVVQCVVCILLRTCILCSMYANTMYRQYHKFCHDGNRWSFDFYKKLPMMFVWFINPDINGLEIIGLNLSSSSRSHCQTECGHWNGIVFTERAMNDINRLSDKLNEKDSGYVSKCQRIVCLKACLGSKQQRRIIIWVMPFVDSKSLMQ